MAIIEAVNLSKSYGESTSIVKAVDRITCAFEDHGLTVITGKSGSGKSTFLRLLALLEHPDSGEVYLDGENITALNDEQKSAIRRERFGFVYQDFNLLSEYTVKDNILLPVYLSNQTVPFERFERLTEFLNIDQLLERRPHELSGGQKQRAAIARAMINRPDILFADEPTGNLDSENARSVFQLFKQIAASGQSVIMVTHDEDLAGDADRTIVIKDGRI